jgi:dTDP-4-amino-4,6-dideoxygalactose transaminase
MIKVPFQDFSRQHNSITAEIDEAFKRVREREWYILGPEVEAFEEEFARYIGTKYAVGVANGTEAIHIALLALQIESGSDVITTANTAVPTATAIRSAGLTPVFSEIGKEDWNLDPESLMDSLTSKTTAIIPVHLYGNPARIKDIVGFAEKKKIFLLEDCAQSHGAEVEGKKAGSFGDAAAFSFYPSKNLGALGDGGMITTDNKEIYNRCLLIRNYGQIERNKHTVWGINSRLDDLQAAFLRVKLNRLDEWNDSRIMAAGLYRKQLAGTPLKMQKANGKNVYHLFVIQLPDGNDRNHFMNYLKENGVSTAIHYPMAIYQQESYRKFTPIKPLALTEKHCASAVSLPIFPYITNEEIEYTCFTIKKYFERG